MPRRRQYGFPFQRELDFPLLWMIVKYGNGAIATPKKENTLLAELADLFSVPQESRKLELRDGQNKWLNHVKWVRKQLCIKGLLDGSEGAWVLTEDGWLHTESEVGKILTLTMPHDAQMLIFEKRLKLAFSLKDREVVKRLNSVVAKWIVAAYDERKRRGL